LLWAASRRISSAVMGPCAESSRKTNRSWFTFIACRSGKRMLEPVMANVSNDYGFSASWCHSFSGFSYSRLTCPCGRSSFLSE
jgi:hypothetical protein